MVSPHIGVSPVSRDVHDVVAMIWLCIASWCGKNVVENIFQKICILVKYLCLL